MNFKQEVLVWRANFFTGLAVVLPSAISIAVVLWLFGTIANITDKLLFLVPPEWKYVNGQTGAIRWYWSVVALLLAVTIISLIGRLTRHFIGRKLIELFDIWMLRIPLLNKIYGAIKQVNEAFSSNKDSSFRQVVLVEFPNKGTFSVGFITGDQNQEIQARTKEKIVSVFVPTTPNPTSGFLILVPESSITRLDMTVADGIKFIISLGAVSPEFKPGTPLPSPNFNRGREGMPDRAAPSEL